MQRLYKFFFLLFLVLFVVSFLYGTLISWSFFNLLKLTVKKGVRFDPVPLSTYLLMGLLQAITYSLVQLTSLIFLFKQAFQQQQKFTLKDMIRYHLWFLALTTAVFIIYALWFALSYDLYSLVLMTGPQFSLPGPLWLPFPLAWIALYIFLAQKLKRTAEYGRKD